MKTMFTNDHTIAVRLGHLTEEEVTDLQTWCERRLNEISSTITPRPIVDNTKHKTQKPNV